MTNRSIDKTAIPQRTPLSPRKRNPPPTSSYPIPTSTTSSPPDDGESRLPRIPDSHDTSNGVEMAHAPLVRTQTAPVFQATPGAGGPPRLNSTMSMGGQSRTSQLSGSTAFRSTTSLNSLATGSTLVAAPPANGQVVATGNIINQAADASRSLYQICVALKARLAKVPGFEPHLQELEELEQDPNGDGICDALWNLLRRGRPMLTIYNALQPDPLLSVDGETGSEERIAKKAVFKVIEACLKVLQMPPESVFGIGDVYRSDTTGFVKVTNVLNAILDLAQDRGLLHDTQAQDDESTPVEGSTKLTQREYIIREMVETERKYVQDLEAFHDFKNVLKENSGIPPDLLLQIFGNIDILLDHQRRFLIKVETVNSQPAGAQYWGDPLVRYEESFVQIYQSFIANQRKASKAAELVFDRMQAVGHPVACDFTTLDGFINKPMQRLTKYPLLLKDLHKRSEEENAKEDLQNGITSSLRILEKANDAVDRELLDEALEELKTRVDDWKNHRVDQFGRLLLHGVYTVVTGKNEQMKPYEIYLFECILLCCKDLIPGKTKDKKDKKLSTNAKINKPKSEKLQLKGRIFMTNVTEVLSFAKPGNYTVQIFWKGDPGVESFNIKFQNEETMKRWAAALDLQRKANTIQTSASPSQSANPEFAWMRDKANMENPYAEQDDDEDDDEDALRTGMPNSQYGEYGYPTQPQPGRMPRNASSSSLRGRAATGESTGSLAGMVRVPPPRFPLPAPPGPAPLNLQTQGAGSPGPRGGDSYFSPVSESPVSSRTSGMSAGGAYMGAYPFPGSRSGTPQAGWDGEHNRYTAPAIPRAPSRDGTVPTNAYGMVNGRNPRGPSMPVMSQSQSLSQQNRSRSYSTPDINGQPNARRTPGGSQGNIPAVPGIPSHLHATHERHDSGIPRSSAGSPNHLRNDLPMRANTQSPGVQRDRLQQQQNYGGAMGQFPAQPIYPRQNTPGPTIPTPLSLANEAGRTVSPPLGTGVMSPDIPLPTQLKVKVNYDKSNYITLVVAYNITYQSLIDRIDAKLARSTTSSIAKGNLKLRYQDEDGDLISIENDDDIQIAFMEWRDGVRNMYNAGVGEIELFCVGELN